MAPPERIRAATNTGTQNKLGHFKKFEIEHPNLIKTIAAHRPQVSLAAVLLYKLNALRVI